MNPRPVRSHHLDHAVWTGVKIGILFGLTHSVQIGAASPDAIGLYGGSSGVSFNTDSPVIASVASIIPAVIGGVAGAGAPVAALTLIGGCS